jgi:geranylgeranyl pyrophosphate synthase
MSSLAVRTQSYFSEAASEVSSGVHTRTQSSVSMGPPAVLGALLAAHCASRAEADAFSEQLIEQALFAPLADFLARPSKQFRARLAGFAWRIAGKTSAPPAELPCIVEALHAGSLIVDDIEDGSTERRGASALHCQYGVPRALNAGNWLYFWPAELLGRLGLSASAELALHRALGRTLRACHEGQALDLYTRVTELQRAAVPAVVRTTTRLKTGKLFELAAVLGATAAGAPRTLVRSLAEFGAALGTGLQMLDDAGGLLSAARRHKGHEDLSNARATWPWAWAAERLAPGEYERLLEIARKVTHRELHPEHAALELQRAFGGDARQAVAEHLTATLARLEREVGSSPALVEIERELTRMQESYG